MLGKKGIVNRQIIGFTKPKRILFFTIKPKPIYKVVEQAQPQGQGAGGAGQAQTAGGAGGAAAQERGGRGRSQGVLAAKRNAMLVPALLEAGIKMTPDQYIASSKKKAAVIGIVAGAAVFGATYVLFPQLIILSPLVGIIGYMMSFNALSMYPINKVKNSGLDVEKDILFAARDMIVSMRSGLPLFNSMATVSVGYGAASKEFEKVIDQVQLGMPMEQAMDEATATSKSPTFKRLMLQASTSIKVGADVINSLQEVINDVSQERVIELRRYGQKLNAIAMFYMLFGVIFPSMGLAVAAIMSTFISFFPISNTTLVLAGIGIVFLQFVFLKMVTSARPSFST